MKTDKEFKDWYLSAVKSALILECGMLEEEANNTIDKFNLKNTIETTPFLIDHYDPRSTALDLKEFISTQSI